MVTKDKTPYTCDMIGYEGTVYCLDCGKPVSYGQSIDAIGHNYGDWTVKKAATTDREGLKVCTCKTCGYVHEEVIPVIIKKSESSNSDTKNSSKPGKGKKSKNDSSGKTEEEPDADDPGGEDEDPVDEEEAKIIEKVETKEVDSDFNVWLYFGIAAGIVLAATAVSVFFLLKKPKKKKGVIPNEKQ